MELNEIIIPDFFDFIFYYNSRERWIEIANLLLYQEILDLHMTVLKNPKESEGNNLYQGSFLIKELSPNYKFKYNIGDRVQNIKTKKVYIINDLPLLDSRLGLTFKESKFDSSNIFSEGIQYIRTEEGNPESLHYPSNEVEYSYIKLN